MVDEQGYRVPEVCRLVGITYRQLDYWARTGLVVPSIREAGGSGTQRLYSFQDLLQLRIIKRWLDTGIALPKIRKAIEHLREVEEPLFGVTLMSDGNTIYAMDSPEAVVDLLRKGQGVFAITVDSVREDLEAQIRKGRRPKRPAAAGGR
ncbi:MAG: MerR family transcriptional regulator [Actinobacteria bacterium]|nr:MerR family transcriptional regulator [Actinomycetota bacterium]